MIITRSPLRITLGGGGTDLPSYYGAYEGFLIAAAIDKYVYITVHRTYVNYLIVKYSKLEKVDHAAELEHPIMREAFRLVGLDGPYLEVTSMADIPAGTGLGSSGSFTTGLLRALHAHCRNLISTQQLAEQACHIEMELLSEPVGKQDPYIAAFGGLTMFRFKKDGAVEVQPLTISAETLHNLEDSLAMFFTGYSRKASSILKDQDDRTKRDDRAIVDNLHYIKELGLRSQQALEAGDLSAFGSLMHEHWVHKKKRTAGMSNSQIDQWYELGMRNGARGGKLIGAGGGGFLLFYTEDKAHLRRAMLGAGLDEVRFQFDFEGTKVIVQ